MATPVTVKTYDLDGSNRDFEIPFEYLARKFVVVTLIGTERTTLTLNIDYRFTQRTIITTTVAYGPSDGYERIEIKRVTSATDRLVDFSDGSILKASDLNTATVQALHIAEEGRDIATDTIGVDNDGNLDARGRRIVNLADATLAGDSVSLRQVQEWSNSVLNSRDAAKASETAAKTSETNAKTSETRSKTSETNAKASENAAKTSETNAKASETLASEWAQKLGAPVVPNATDPSGGYSSRHYAVLSQQAQAAAETARAAAAASAAAALVSETNAKSSEAALGNAVTLFANVESSVANGRVTWRPNVSHRVQSADGSRQVSYGADEINSNTNLVLRNSGGYVNLSNGAMLLARTTGAASIQMYSSNGITFTINAAVNGITQLFARTPGSTEFATFTFSYNGIFGAPNANIAGYIVAGGQISTTGSMRIRSLKVPCVVETEWYPFVRQGEWGLPTNEFGVVPYDVAMTLRNVTADAGYVPGDIVAVGRYRHNGTGAATVGPYLVMENDHYLDGIKIRVGSSAQVLEHKTTRTATTLTDARWEVMFTITGAI